MCMDVSDANKMTILSSCVSTLGISNASSLTIRILARLIVLFLAFACVGRVTCTVQRTASSAWGLTALFDLVLDHWKFDRVDLSNGARSCFATAVRALCLADSNVPTCAFSKVQLFSLVAETMERDLGPSIRHTLTPFSVHRKRRHRLARRLIVLNLILVLILILVLFVLVLTLFPMTARRLLPHSIAWQT